MSFWGLLLGLIAMVFSMNCFAVCDGKDLIPAKKWSIEHDGFTIQPLKFKAEHEMHLEILKYLFQFKPDDGIMQTEPLTLEKNASKMHQEISRDFFLKFKVENPKMAAYLEALKTSVVDQAHRLLPEGFMLEKVQLRWTAANEIGTRRVRQTDGVYYRVLVPLEGKGTIVSLKESEVATSMGDLLVISGTLLAAVAPNAPPPTYHLSPDPDGELRLYLSVDFVPVIMPKGIRY